MESFIKWYGRFYPPNGVSTRRRIIIHLFFWVFYFIMQNMAFINNVSWDKRLIIASSVITMGATVFYLFTYCVIPNFRSTKNYIWGLFFFILLYVLNFTGNYLFNIYAIQNDLFHELSDYHIYAKQFVANGWKGLLKPINILYDFYLVLSSVMIAFMIKLLNLIFQNSIKSTIFEKEKINLEIDFLRSQLNSNFLQNTLQSIKKKVDQNREEAGDAIIKLSGVLKYILYNKNESLIDLEKEMKFISSYIELEKLNENDNLEIKFTQTGFIKDSKIIPFILVNFIETVFHNLISRGNEKHLLSFQFDLKDDILNLKIETNVIMQSTARINTYQQNIKNAEARLRSNYANKYSLSYSEKNESSWVDLRLKLIKK